jgi:hypothetical protein
MLALAMSACGGSSAVEGSQGKAPAAATAESETATGAASTAVRSAVDPADFVATITNPFLPFVPGTRWRYRGSSAQGPQFVTVTVTSRTKVILGVSTVVVHDVVTMRGAVVEDTWDWYAQDRRGNVWYFGENTKIFKNGRLDSTEGSWVAGKAGAEPGIVLEANPKVGDIYQQEHFPGHAEDRAEVLSTRARTTVPLGNLHHLLKTKDTTPLEPDLVEHKYFARGIGSVREVDVRGDSDEIKLVSIRRP